MLLKLLKLNANEAIISGATATSKSGSVTFRKICHAPPPSTRAASTSCDGIDCSAPSETRKKYGTVSQTLTKITETRAHHGSKSHGIPRCVMLLTTPKSSLSKPCQTSSERKAGTAYGITSSERYVRWNLRPGLFSVIARNSPRAKETKTTAVAKKSVHANTFRNGERMRGLCTMRLKFLRPTYAFQPGSSSAPLAATYEPRPLFL